MRFQAKQHSYRHAVNVATRACLRRVDVGVRVDLRFNWSLSGNESEWRLAICLPLIFFYTVPFAHEI